MPSHYNSQGPPGPMMRRQNPAEYYQQYYQPQHYQHPQQQQQQPQPIPFYNPQWYPQQYPVHPNYQRPYPYQHQMQPQHPMVVSSHQTPSPLPHHYRPHIPSPNPILQQSPSYQPPEPSLPETPLTSSTPVLLSQSPTPSTPTTVESFQTTSESDRRLPNYPKLPWLSVPNEPFPARTRRRRKKPLESQTPDNSQLPQTPNSDKDSNNIESTDPSLNQTPNSIALTKQNARPIIPAVPVAVKSIPSQLKAEEEEVKEELKEELPSKSQHKSWADLVKIKSFQNSVSNPVTQETTKFTIPDISSKPSTSAEIIRAYNANSDARYTFLEPRGLVNTGNMCYMNSILQVLLYCIPFYSFLDVVHKNAAHNFKSDTPILDAMILFMKEFRIISTSTSSTLLREQLKDAEVEKYGDQLIPNYIYEAIKQIPRFSNMRRGHQQDAEEFLGMLLEALHEESISAFKSTPASSTNGTVVNSESENAHNAAGDGWHEVGPKQKAAVTRSSGDLNTNSPITKIFGGQLRSELKVPGLKPSITLEPYRPLQLDIGSSEVNNIVDALKRLTKSETLTGDFNSPKGPGTTATKQVFIESLPPVLILHLKRFQYDNTGGVQKIWKNIGYPLELTIPKEVFPTQKRAGLALAGLPKYRLTAVVYHHGKNAISGHYTVDVLRQDGVEWIRFDDTVIRRLRTNDVVEAGANEDNQELSNNNTEKHKREASVATGKTLYETIDNSQEENEESGWNKVNGSGSSKESGRKWASIANGSPPPSNGRGTPRDGFKENKVAYILFYRKVE